MKHEKKFREQEQQQVSETQARQAGAKEFGSVEELLRYDASQTAVPPDVTHRLDRSLQKEPCRPRPWWRRILGS